MFVAFWVGAKCYKHSASSPSQKSIFLKKARAEIFLYLFLKKVFVSGSSAPLPPLYYKFEVAARESLFLCRILRFGSLCARISASLRLSSIACAQSLQCSRHKNSGLDHSCILWDIRGASLPFPLQHIFILSQMLYSSFNIFTMFG